MSPESVASLDVPTLAPRPSLTETPNAALVTSPCESVAEIISNGAFSKTWVLPPRKKPGRKAANDVPPTVLSHSLRA